MPIPNVRRVVIAGGGTAGWSAAAALSKVLGPLLTITLIESDEIGTIGVGESTIPTIRGFHQLLGLKESEFLFETDSTYKLAISFENWRRQNDQYFHSFGVLGQSHWMAPFHHLWLQARAEGRSGDIGEYCLEWAAARAGRFGYDAQNPINYAYQFDAFLYGRLLRKRSEAAGVTRVQGKIARVEQDAVTGFLTAISLETGERVEGDLFIDCTGFSALLIEKTLGTGFEDWGHWLPTDRAIAVQTASHGELTPYTRAVAHGAGWRWRIPLQSRVGNGLVYCGHFLSDDEAQATLISDLDAPKIIEPRLIRYQTGRRRKAWNKNCVALGLAAGFIEPLESTSIHLIQMGISRLLQLFPYEGVTQAVTDLFNSQSQQELEGIRDFVMLHYRLNERPEPFWLERANMALPDSLKTRIQLFIDEAFVYQTGDELFRVDSWAQVMLGQGMAPKSWHRLGGLMDRGQLTRALDSLRSQVVARTSEMPSHFDFIQKQRNA